MKLIRALIILLFAVSVFAQRPTPTVVGGATSTASYRPPFRVSSTGVLYVSISGSAGAAVQRPTPTVVGGADSTGTPIAILTDADGTVRVSCSDCGGSGGLSGSIADTQIAFGVGTAIGGVSTFTYSTTSNSFMLTGTTPRLGVGTFATSGTGALNQELQVNTTSTSTQRGFGSYQFSTDALGGRFDCGKSRGTPSAMTVIVTADVECRLEAWAFDGVNWINSARIAAVSSGTIAATRTPSQWVFSTSTNATPSVITTALTIDSAQLATFTAGISSQTLATTTGTFATSLTSPIVYGGSAAGSSLSLVSTSGTGTTDSTIFKGGTNGATTWATADSSGFTSNLNSFISTTFKSPAGSAVAINATAPTAAASSAAGAAASLAASSATAGTTNNGAAAGAATTITGGNGARLVSGNGAGGVVFINGGAAIGSATDGAIITGAVATTGLTATNGPYTRTDSGMHPLIAVSAGAAGADAHVLNSVMYSSNATSPAGMMGWRSVSNTSGTLSAVLAGSEIAEYVGRGAASSSAWDNTAAGMYVISSQTHTGSNQGKYVQFAAVADNTAARTNAWRVSSSPVGDFIPESDNTYNIGSTTARVAGITAVSMVATGGTITVSNGTSTNTISNTSIAMPAVGSTITLGAALPAGYTLWNQAGTSGLNGRVYAANLTTSAANQTDSICMASTGELIADTQVGGCIVSSRAFKTDEGPADRGLDLVMALKPILFTYKNDGVPANRSDWSQHFGFFAEDVEQVEPRLVDHDSEGKPHAVQYTVYTAVLTKAIQEQQGEIAELKRRIQVLEAQ